MKGLMLPILFAALTAFFWGLYGPALGNARSSAVPPAWSPFKPYLLIGLAYLVWGCLGGAGGMLMFRDNFSFSGIYRPALTWGFIAGTLGAIGALTLTFAMVKAKGNAALVMPIVFGGATSVSALVGVYRLWRAGSSPNPMLWVGMALVVVGIVLVARNTPHGGPAHGKSHDDTQAARHAPAEPQPAASETSG